MPIRVRSRRNGFRYVTQWRNSIDLRVPEKRMERQALFTISNALIDGRSW